MENATDNNQQSSKRTRFSTTETNTSIDTQPPSKLAESYIRKHVASLHPQIATIVEKLGKEHILLLSKRDHKKKANQRLVDDKTLLPRSVRFNFNLTASKRIDTTQEYTALKEKASEIIEKCGNELKKLIIETAKLEIAELDKDIQQHLVRSIRIITQSFLIVHNSNANPNDKVYTLIRRHCNDLTINCPMSIERFSEIYKEIHNIETFPSSTYVEPTDHSDSMIMYRLLNDNSNNNVTDPLNDITAIKNTIEAVFISTWLQFKQQQKLNEVAAELKKLSTSYFTDKATSDAVMAVDAEPGADKQELKTLIRLETQSENKALKQQISALSSQLKKLTEQKNSTQRGRGGASKTKENANNKTTTTSSSNTSGRSSSNDNNQEKRRRRGRTSSRQTRNNGKSNERNPSNKKTSKKDKEKEKEKVDDDSSVNSDGKRKTNKKSGTRRSGSNRRNSNNSRGRSKSRSERK
jgi:hypothetical protein